MQDYWPRQWARAYVEFAAGENVGHDLGLRFEGGRLGRTRRQFADGHGSVPRFHLTWGTGRVVRIFAEPVLEAENASSFRHRVDELIVSGDAAVGVRGAVLAPCDDLDRGRASNRDVVE